MLAPVSDLQSNYSYVGTQNALSVQGFSGSPGNGPFPLPTDNGALLINSDSIAAITPNVTFTIAR
jgi:hypothetical protein